MNRSIPFQSGIRDCSSIGTHRWPGAPHRRRGRCEGHRGPDRGSRLPRRGPVGCVRTGPGPRAHGLSAARGGRRCGEWVDDESVARRPGRAEGRIPRRWRGNGPGLSRGPRCAGRSAAWATVQVRPRRSRTVRTTVQLRPRRSRTRVGAAFGRGPVRAGTGPRASQAAALRTGPAATVLMPRPTEIAYRHSPASRRAPRFRP